MAGEWKINNPIVIGSLASDPSVGYGGEIYYNTTSNVFRYYNGTVWANVSSGSGTVTTVSVASANGFAGTVATPTSTPVITISTTVTGLLQGNGTAISAYTGGNLTDSTAGADGITVTSGTGAVIGTGTSIAQTQSSASLPGYLSAADWTTFNSKQPAGNYITALTGDVTAAGPGSVAATLATVNSNVGSFGSSTSIPSITVNAKGLITAASGNAVIAPAGTLTGTTLASNVVTSSLTSLGTQSQALDMGTFNIINIADPVNPQDAATKHYVDLISGGIDWKDEVQAFADTNVPLTGGATLTIDGYSVQNGDSVILSNQTTATENGVYTAAGIGTAYTLTLRADSNPPAIGFAYLVIEGTTWALSGWVVNQITPNTNFAQFTGPQELVFDAPLSRTGSDVSLLFGNGLTLSGSSLVVLNSDPSILVAAGGISVQEDPAGAIITDGAGIAIQLEATNATLQIVSNMLGVKLDPARAITTGTAGIGVNVDGVTIDINGSNEIEVKIGGISDAQISATAAIELSKLAALDPNRVLFSNNTGVISDDESTAPNNRPNMVVDTVLFGPTTSSFVEKQYVDITLTNNQGSAIAVDPSTTFAFATYAGFEAKYYITDAGTPTIISIGKIIIACNSDASIAPLTYSYTDTANGVAAAANSGVVFTAVVNGSNIELRYTTTNTSTRTMRIDIDRFLR